MERLQLQHLLYVAVQQNPGITVGRLSWAISLLLGEDEKLVHEVVMSMTRHETLPRCFNYYCLPKERTRGSQQVIILRLNDKNKQYIENLFTTHQGIHKYEVPNLDLSGMKHGGNALEKVGVTSALLDNTGRKA